MSASVSPANICQKYLAVNSARRTVPETANTTTMLIRLLATIDLIDAPLAGGRPVLEFLRFAVRGVALAGIAISGDGGQAVEA